MAIETLCAGCGQKLAVADEHAGKQARCPACGQIYTVPQLAARQEFASQESVPQDSVPQDSVPQNSASQESTPYGSVTNSGSIDPVERDASSSGSNSNPALAETVAGNPFGSEGSGAAASDSGSPSGIDHFWMRTADGTEYGPVDRPNLNRWFSEGRVGPGYTIRQAMDGPWQPADVFRPHGSSPGTAPPPQSNYPGMQASTGAAGGMALDSTGYSYSFPGASQQVPTQQSDANHSNASSDRVPSGPSANGGSAVPNMYGTAGRPVSTNAAVGGSYAGVNQAYPGAPQYAKSDPSGLVLTMGIVSWVCLLVCAPIGWIPGLVAWISGKRGLADIQSGQADPSNANLVQVGYYLGMANVILSLLVAVLGAALIAIGIIADM